MAARRSTKALNPPSKRSPGRHARAKGLDEYRRKREFRSTPEPAGRIRRRPPVPRFVIQKHDARRLHYDLRLEVDGVLKSWAVPRGPSLDPAQRRLAVQTEDHPVEYLKFEGVIPEGEYGAGPMIVWDLGTYRNLKTDAAGREIPLSRALETGSAKIWLDGEKLKGGFSLVRKSKGEGKTEWFLIKSRDEHADPGRDILAQRPESILSRRTVEDLQPPGAMSKHARTARQRKTSTRRALPTRGSDPRPAWITPMLATLVEVPPSDAEWIFEHKYDGFRALAFRDGDKVTLLSRNRKSLADRFPEIADALSRQPLDDFVIDGEIVALHNDRPSFSEIQKRLKATTLEAAQQGGIVLRYYIFDLLYARGYDTRALPLSQRKTLLRKAITFEDPLRFSDHLTGDGGRLLRKACRDGWEGLIAKRSGDPYISGRGRSWLKLKCSLRQEFVIGGYTDPQGSRTAFGALLLGYYHNRKLKFAGKVGTGYSDRVLRDTLALLQPLERSSSPFAPDSEIPKRGVHFVQPQLVCEVGFSEWTHDDHIRHPRFLGLRPDKKAAEVRRETPARIRR